MSQFQVGDRVKVKDLFHLAYGLEGIVESVEAKDYFDCVLGIRLDEGSALPSGELINAMEGSVMLVKPSVPDETVAVTSVNAHSHVSSLHWKFEAGVWSAKSYRLGCDWRISVNAGGFFDLSNSSKRLLELLPDSVLPEDRAVSFKTLEEACQFCTRFETCVARNWEKPREILREWEAEVADTCWRDMDDLKFKQWGVVKYVRYIEGLVAENGEGSIWPSLIQAEFTEASDDTQ